MRLTARLSVLVCLLIMSGLSSIAQAQDCPLGKTCFYLPPIMSPPPSDSSQGYTEVVIMSAPTALATYTLQYSAGTPAAGSGTVAVGAAPQLTVYPGNMISAFNTVEQKGVMITSDVPDLIVEQRTPATYWQSSSTIRSHTMALGTRFRLAGYNLNQSNNGDGTGYDFVSLYAPQGATITVAPPTSAPSSFWTGQATKNVTVTLTAGQTYMLRTLTGIDIDATLVTSTAAIAVTVGGRGWGCGSSGDEGADQAMPTSLYGQEFVVRRYPAPSLQDVRIVADTDSTAISLNGVVQTTINAGASYTISGNTGISYITADKPVGVFQNAGSTYCENDLAFIPPLAFTSTSQSNLGFRTIGTGYGFVVAPTTSFSSLRLDDAVVSGTPVAVTGRSDLSTLNLSLSAGTHKLTMGTDFQFGMVSDTGGTGMFAYYNPWRIAGCGDAMRSSTEACDDSGVVDGDGCSSVCGVEPGYACSGAVGAASTCYCASDLVCSTGNYCAQGASTNACATKLANGATLPAGHGTCGGVDGTLGSAATGCASGVCNATTGTCAAANGGACTLANQCVANICGSNSQCGGVNGESSCTAGSQCQSTRCAPTGAVCVPSPSGCWVDADCTSDKFCHRSTYTCTTKLTTGASLPSDSLHATCGSGNTNAACQSGSCNATATTCALATGVSCSGNSQCASNRCGSNSTCGGVTGVDSCSVATQAVDCQSGYCSQSGTCVSVASGCYVDADCGSGNYCFRSSAMCLPKRTPGMTLPTDTLHDTCSGGVSSACDSGLCNATTSTCGNSNGATGCTTDGQCASNVCGSNGNCGGVSGEDPCTVGTQAADCQSGFCSSSSGTCVGGSSGCWTDADCSSDKFCHRASFMCQTKLVNGMALPQDTLHDSCGGGQTNASCASGRCNATTGTCAGTNANTSCTLAAQCITNRCGSNGSCGGASGQDACTVATQVVDCQSGYCSTTAGRCVNGASGCWVDSDCLSTDYCHRSSFTCTTRLTPGTALPQDSLHDSCGVGSLNPACQSGTCNATAGTCALANGSNCSGNSQCVNGQCAGNGKCGGVNGQGSCSVATQAADCQSGYCSQSGTCVSVASGCYVDADCNSGNYCFRSSAMCLPKRTPGMTLPTDTLHNTCSGGVSSACDSGLCNTTTSTCGNSNGATGCTTDGQCASNVCGSNGNCGGVSGEDPCTVGTQAADCQSGFCSSSSGTCVGGSSGCWTDADCSSDKFCHRASFMCQTKLVNGTSLPQDALHDSCGGGQTNASCASGRCNATTGTCAGTNASTSCTLAAQCITNLCGSNGSCGGASGQDACTVATQMADCQSGYCSTQSGTCVTGASGCWVDADCSSDKYCHRSNYTCTTKLTSGMSLPQDTLHASCSSGTNTACQTGQCNRTAGTCAGANSSTSCSAGAQCATNLCGSNGQCGGVSGQDGCFVASQATDCQSGQCSLTAGVCVEGAFGCWVDADCSSQEFCHRATFSCEAKQPNGVSLPQDSLHGSCGSGDTNSACDSGRCNPIVGTCAGPNSSTDCTDADECITNRCGSSGKCGGSSGQDSCTVATQVADCQSGVCSPTAMRCVEGSSGCWVDADCGGSEYCHRASFLCKPKLVPGAPLPVDTLHDTCASGNLNAACDSGQCNATATTCAGPNGSTSCLLAAECSNNRCGSNGSCGGVNGADTCAAESASRDCQSGHCSATSGKCVAVESGCWVDADCASGQFCHRATYTCTAKLEPGTSLPQDGLHASCASGDTNVACESGRCNSGTSTCAVMSGRNCSGNSQCIQGRCGTDQRCGLTPGEPCTTASFCRTGICGVSSVCLPAGGCDRDTSCGQGSYCDLETLTCKAKLGPGSPIPGDHGTCGIIAGDVGDTLTTCTSGVCNRTSNTCALPNGMGPCSSASECGTNVCGQDGQCGRADGAGPCSAQTAAVVCRSRTCSVSGVCMPMAAGGCWVDADCGESKYCDRGALTCRDKRAAGEALPSDGLHEVCPGSRVSSACALGLCNSETNTCAGPNLTLCSSAAECAWNACDPSDGRCGFALGGACDADNAADVCRSGACQPSGECLSAGPCTKDSDCADGDHCDAGLACASDLPNGRLIPAGRGVCGGAAGSLGDAVSACQSGACNPASNTCASVFGGACAGGNECTGGGCGTDNLCGFTPGQGPCTPLTAARVCRNGACSASGSVCIPSDAHSCWNDDECGAAEFCRRDTFTCTAKLARGGHLPADGLHDTCPAGTRVSAACVSGRCNAATHTCAEDNAATCTSAGDCIANVCSQDGKCGLPLASGPCIASNAATVCRSHTCSAAGVCSLSNTCANDADCAQGRYCETGGLTCVPLLLPGASIPVDRGVCTADASSPANRACTGGRCNPLTNTCAGENNALSCTAASECATNVCGIDGRCGRAIGSGPCSEDNAESVCRSGHCAARSGVCVPDGESCWLDEDCGDARFCDRATLQCTAAFYSGQSLPVDGTHDTCPASGSNAACLSGRCNAQTDTCASENSIECAAPSECSTNLCGENGQCGLADGESGCDFVTAASVCQSGVCLDTGACGSEATTPVPGCTRDAQCSGDQYCDLASGKCLRKPIERARLSGGGGLCSVSTPGSGNASGLLTALACLAALTAGSRRRRKQTHE